MALHMLEVSFRDHVSVFGTPGWKFPRTTIDIVEAHETIQEVASFLSKTKDWLPVTQVKLFARLCAKCFTN